MISINLIIALCVIVFSTEVIVSVPTSKVKTDKNAKSKGKASSVSNVDEHIIDTTFTELAKFIRSNYVLNNRHYKMKCLKWVEAEMRKGKECVDFILVRLKDGDIKNDDDNTQSEFNAAPQSIDLKEIRKWLKIIGKKGHLICLKYNNDRSECLKVEVVFSQDSPESGDGEESRDDEESGNDVGGSDDKDDDDHDDDDNDDDDDEYVDQETKQVLENTQTDVRSQRKKPARKRKRKQKLQCILWDKKGRCVRFAVSGMWLGRGK